MATTNDAQEPLVRIKPAPPNRVCAKRLGLDPAGKPKVCGRVGYILVRELVLCRSHFESDCLLRTANGKNPITREQV